MFEKAKLKRQIEKIRKEIEAVEAKRVRSQGALVEAILKHETPLDEDVDYFNKYTVEIDKLRDEMQEMKAKLSQMK